MITPTGSVRPPETQNDSPLPASKPYHPQSQSSVTVKSGEVSGDQVTLKSAGEVDHDGDSE